MRLTRALALAAAVPALTLGLAAPAHADDADARRSQKPSAAAAVPFAFDRAAITAQPAALTTTRRPLTDHRFSTTCTATDSRGIHWAGSVTMTGTIHHSRSGGVTIRGAKYRANGQMFTITASRYRDEAIDYTLAHGYTGVYSPGEATHAWSPEAYAGSPFGHWILRGHRTNTPSAQLHGCSVWG